MSTTSESGSLREVRECAAALLEVQSTAELGRWIDAPTSTVTRRLERNGGVLLRREDEDFLTIAKRDPGLCQAVVRYLMDLQHAPTAEASALGQALADDAVESAEITRVAMTANRPMTGPQILEMRQAALKRQATGAALLRHLEAALSEVRRG